MKYLAFMSPVLLALVIIEVSAESQRRPHCRPLPQLGKDSGTEEIDSGRLTERDKIIAECEIPNRPKPATEAEIKPLHRLGEKAISHPRPSYPSEAREAKVSGAVQVDVVVDEKGRVIWAKSVTGHPLLQEASRKAACRSGYSPAMITGRPVKSWISITYNFVL